MEVVRLAMSWTLIQSGVSYTMRLAVKTIALGVVAAHAP
jgi:hypothetical protein